MRVSSQLHKLVDASFGKGGVILAPDDRQFVPNFRDWGGLPLFVLQCSLEELYEQDYYKMLPPDTRLPYPEMIIEGDCISPEAVARYKLPDGGRNIIHARQSGDDIEVSLALSYEPKRDRWDVGIGMYVLHPGRQGGTCYLPEYDQFEETTRDLMRAAAATVVGLVNLMHERRYESETSTAPEKLNRKRQKLGKAAIPTYTAITLRLPAPASTGGSGG